MALIQNIIPTLRISQTIAVVLCGFLFNRHLVRAWHSMQKLARAMNHKWIPSVRRYSRILTVAAIIFGCGNMGYSLAVGMRLCWLNPLDQNGSEAGQENVEKFNDRCEEFGMLNYILFVWIISRYIRK